MLAGSAVAGRPTAHTLRKSPGGPIAAIAENNSVAAWFTASTKGCNLVHILSPGKHDRSLPAAFVREPDLPLEPQRRAAAARRRSAHVHGTLDAPRERPFAGRPSHDRLDRRVRATADRLAHASDGTGDWLEGVAGAGRTLAYSWDDVEYVDPDACLSHGMCKQKIADGGIRLVTRTDVNELPGAEPALQLAAAAGRIAYVPATVVKSGRPTVSLNNTLRIVDAVTGDQLGQAFVQGIPVAIALSSKVLAVLTASGPHDRISWFSATDGTKLGDAVVSANAAPQLAASDRLIVYRVGRLLRGISTRTGHNGKLAKTGLNYVGLALARGRLIWAQNHGNTGRLRALAVG